MTATLKGTATAKTARNIEDSLRIFRSSLIVAALMLSSILAPLVGIAQTADSGWEIGEFELGELRWGKQTRGVRVANNTDDYRFLAIECVARSTQQGFTQPRTSRVNYVIFPGDEGFVKFTIDVAESYGETIVDLKIYDVIDTLDDLSLGTKLLEFSARVPVIYPEGMKEYVELAPRPGNILRFHKSLSSDLQLALNLMLARGISVTEMSNTTELPEEYIRHRLQLLVADGLAANGPQGPVSNLTAIENLPFERIDSLIATVASKMSSELTGSIDEYRKLHLEMIADGIVTGDSMQSVEGSGVLFQVYAMVGGLTLWSNVGAPFLGFNSEPPLLYDPASPCDQVASGFGYLLADHRARDGKHYFYHDRERDREVFGVNAPKMLCYTPSAGSKAPNYRITSGRRPLIYGYDSKRADKLTSVLQRGLHSLRDRFETEIQALFAKNGTDLTSGHRLWLWNRVATETLDNLTQAGILIPLERDYFVWSRSL